MILFWKVEITYVVLISNILNIKTIIELYKNTSISGLIVLILLANF